MNLMFNTGRTFVRNSLNINFLHNLFHTEITKVRTSGFVLIKFRRLQIVSCRYFSNMPAKKDFERLPTNIQPINYCLRLKPNLKSFTFEGTETIDVEVNKEILVRKAPWQCKILGQLSKWKYTMMSSIYLSYQSWQHFWIKNFNNFTHFTL